MWGGGGETAYVHVKNVSRSGETPQQSFRVGTPGGSFEVAPRRATHAAFVSPLPPALRVYIPRREGAFFSSLAVARAFVFARRDPQMRGVPLLRREHPAVASLCSPPVVRIFFFFMPVSPPSPPPGLR